MALEPGADVPEHVDIHYYWRTHLRIHIPVLTNPKVAFTCNGETIHMPAGECWILDSFYPHTVVNGGSERRVHLVLDTVGSGELWDLVNTANEGAAEPKFIAPGETMVRSLDFEQVNAPLIMSPWEMKAHLAYLADWTDEQPLRREIFEVLDRFVMSWEGTWAAHGISEGGVPLYARHLTQVQQALAPLRGRVIMRNGRGLLDSVDRFVFANAIAQEVLQRLGMAGRPLVRMTA